MDLHKEIKSAENWINECQKNYFLLLIDLKYNWWSKVKIAATYCVYSRCKSKIYNKYHKRWEKGIENIL